MTDELERRLRAADPMNSEDTTQTPPSWISDLVEETMNEPINPQRRRWQIPAAAAAVLVLGVGSYAVAQTGDDSSRPPTTAAAPLKLSVAATRPGMGSCIRFSVGLLAKMPVAFSGSVQRAGNGTVLLDVDHWYRGGDAQQVEITWPGPSGPQGNGTFIEGGVSFVVGQRFLVTATHGVVNGCGYSTRWTAHTAAMFKAAFT